MLGVNNVGSKNKSPAADKAKKITTLIENYLEKLGGNDEKKTATQVAVSSFVRVVKQLNRSIVSAAEAGSVGGDALLKLSSRTNEYFTKFVGGWLKSEAIARHFVFELGGFEFLLDTISKGNSEDSQNND